MSQDFEYISYKDAEWIAMLENRAAELERRLLEVTASGGPPVRGAGTAPAGDLGYGILLAGAPGEAAPGANGRTEALISRGRPRARAPRARWVRARWVRSHWRAAGAGMVALVLAVLALALVLPGGGASWPGSVARVEAEITAACQNPDVAAEPSGVNFACSKPTQAVLWVFSLLTSGDNPAFADSATGRRGLEPIAPAQGGNIFWSLNLHHVYDPGSAADSLMVAARAINNIIGGATLTSSSGTPLVEPGLESRAANCLRYTGSAQLVARAGFPARCASPVTSSAGQAALVSDVFRQWMGGASAQVAVQAGVLFANAGNPGDPRVQAILASLPQ